MTRTIAIDNLADLARISELAEKMRQKALDAIEDQMMLMVYYAQDLCPVKTGALRSTIRMERSGNSVAVKVGGFGVNYAEIVEERHPFMLPAWLAVYPTIKEAIEARIEEVLP